MRFLLLFLVAVLASGGVVLAQADPLEFSPFVSGDQFTEMQTAFFEWVAGPLIGVFLGMLAVGGVNVVFRRLKGVVSSVGGGGGGGPSDSEVDDMWADSFEDPAEHAAFMKSGMTWGQWEAAKVPSGFVGGGAGWGAPSASDREDYERAMRDRDDF